MFFFILQFLQFLLGDSPEDLDFQYMHSFLPCSVCSFCLEALNFQYECVFFYVVCSLCKGKSNNSRGMFVFILQFLQFLRETLLTIQNFDVCFRFDPVVSVVSAWRLQIFDMCVFFSMQFVVYLRENQIIPGVCSFLPCSFCSF